MDVHSSVYADDAFRRWKSTRVALTRAINGYLFVSAGLRNESSFSTSHASRLTLERALSGVDLELSSLQLEEEKLKQMCTTLANERNRSRVPSPVHKLPPEILASIFVIATSRYTRRDRTASRRKCSSPTVLSSVSSSWRQIALGTPSLWSYIDLAIGDRPRPLLRKQAELWVERSCNAVLYVEITEYNQHFGQNGVPRHQVIGILEFLGPQMNRVGALELNVDFRGQHDVLSSVLSRWAKHSSTDIKKTLDITNNFYNDAVLGPASDGSFSADEFNSFFRSFNRLAVQNCGIHESVMFHEGLVELHLGGIDRRHSPTQEEFAAMLAPCPRLRILVLAECWIEPSEEIPNPITLNHLQFLSLESEGGSHGFVHVLPLLSIRSEDLSMSLTLDDGCDFVDEARAFFSRTKVTRLHVWGIQGHMSLPRLLYPMLHLETLALDYFDFSDAYSHSLVPWPRLRTLYLKDPLIDMSCLQQFVGVHPSLTKLHIYRPKTDGRPGNSMTDEECAHLVGSMHMVEDFKIEFDWGSRTIGTWDFVILDIW